MLGIPDKIINDGGPLYNGREWQKFGREMGIKMVKCTPEHPQSNGIMEKFNAVLVKIVHAAITEGRDSRTEVQKTAKLSKHPTSKYGLIPC